jgi:hypothetical protein
MEHEHEAQQRYRRAARLLASKLNINWRDLPPQQVLEYALKLDFAAQMRAEKQAHQPDTRANAPNTP